MSATTAVPNAAQPVGWWPSRYGADDRIGSLNELGADAVLRGLAEVRSGTVFDLSHVLDEQVPAFPGRSFRQYLTTPAHQVNARRPDVGPLGGWGGNDVNWIVEQVSSTSQLGTHIDGLNHLQIGDRMYNGHRLADVVEEYGTNTLGIESLPQIVTRGVLVDIANLLGVARLERGHVITPDETDRALAAAGISVAPGDGIEFHTGWGGQWAVDNAGYLDGEPGPGLAMVDWLVDHRVSVTGCDTWSFGPVPAEDPARPFEVPQALSVRHGVVVVENLKLDELARAGVSAHLLVIAHPKPRGATGAWVAPLAIT